MIVSTDRNTWNGMNQVIVPSQCSQLGLPIESSRIQLVDLGVTQIQHSEGVNIGYSIEGDVGQLVVCQVQDLQIL